MCKTEVKFGKLDRLVYQLYHLYTEKHHPQYPDLNDDDATQIHSVIKGALETSYSQSLLHKPFLATNAPLLIKVIWRSKIAGRQCPSAAGINYYRLCITLVVALST